LFFIGCAGHNGAKLAINDQGYFEKPGLNVMVLNDIYPEGHQGGIEIIQHGKRVATNGNLSLQPTPGQWEPYPRLLDKEIRKADETIVVTLKYPDSTRIKTPDQPIIYPYLEFTYRISVIAEVDQFKIIVDLEKPLPAKWIGQVGFYLELFPGYLFGKSYHLDEQCGVFPRYANSPVQKDQDGEYEAMPMAEGRRLIVAPEDKFLKMTIENKRGTLELLDGRVKHNNGWFVVRSLIPEKATNNAIEWVIKPNTVSGWKYGPVIHTSQLGYHSNQTKKAIIELDRRDKSRKRVKIKRVRPEGGFENVLSIRPEKCQDFLRYRYLRADFTDVSESGIYVGRYFNTLFLPNPITTAQPLSKTKLLELIDARLAMEGMIVSLAIDKLTDKQFKVMKELLDDAKQHLDNFNECGLDYLKFHYEIRKAAKNIILQEIVRVITNLYTDDQVQLINKHMSCQDDFKLHSDLYDALKRRNKEKAIELMEIRLNRIGEIIIKYLPDDK